MTQVLRGYTVQILRGQVRADGHERVRDLFHRIHRSLAAQVTHCLRLEDVRHEDAEHDHERLEEDEAQHDRDHPRLEDRLLRLLRRAVAGERAACANAARVGPE